MMRHISSAILAFAFAATSLPAIAQTVIATIPIGGTITNGAVNPVSNKMYVISGTTLSVIDGASNTVIATVQLGSSPASIFPDKVSNKIYISDRTDNTVTVVDGATNTVTAVIPVQTHPLGLCVNSVTDKIYVVNRNSNSVSVIDGNTNQVKATVPVGTHPTFVWVNPVTNMIYVTNLSDGTVSVIDGTTDAVTHTVTVGQGPALLLVNTVTNKAYVNNYGDFQGNNNSISVIDLATLDVNTIPMAGIGALDVNQVSNKIALTTANNTVTIIDGATLSLTPLTVGSNPSDVESDAVTNKLYVMNNGDNTVTVIDEATDSENTVTVGMGPLGASVNPVTNRIYVLNAGDSTVSVIAGASASALQFVPITPCRLLDTRPEKGGSGPIPGGTSLAFNLPQLAQSASPPCESLASAAAYSLNVSVVPSGALGYLTIWPTGEDQPVVATLNSLNGRIKADAAIVAAGYQGAVTVFVTQTTNVILDINGYFAPASPSTLTFYPLPPCRVADTRKDNFPAGLGSPFLPGLQERDFPILNAASCNIPTTAAAYSLNFSVVPHGALGYMTVWPTGQDKPTVSTLNDIPGTIIANAAIVPAGTAGDISVYPSNDTDVIIDINGYFDTPGAGGLSLYPAAPCRVIDTRKVGSGQPFSGTLSPPVDVVDSPCATPAEAQAYVFNATVVPYGALGYLTLWPDGTDRPVVSTLNALDGSITNNMAIVPTNNGKIDAYASGITQLILDISSYFAP